MFTFNHFNFNVLDLERSLAFYKDALGLAPVSKKEADDGSFTLVYLGDGVSHLAFTVPDMDAAHQKHQDMGCICFENPAMGIYFIEDPDGYWIEIVPDKG